MNAVAKFTCVEKKEGLAGFEIKLTPVSDGSEENKGFYKYTPSGEILLGIVSAPSAKAFIVGKEYYVEFTVADAQ